MPIQNQHSVTENPAPVLEPEVITDLDHPEAGATTAEYGIVMLAAVGFAGLLVVILKSEEVRQMLLNIVQNALSTAGG
ncbi:DUF4244 domain-containing protein [Rothia sp. LK2588]|uniref:DUF4244 domain-containing protein n=1 Tax=Rothia sp. LK2588 TaxID=3114369 RepID=UPI0034CD9E1C